MEMKQAIRFAVFATGAGLLGFAFNPIGAPMEPLSITGTGHYSKEMSWPLVMGLQVPPGRLVCDEPGAR
jgi:hypothetical protein